MTEDDIERLNRASLSSHVGWLLSVAREAGLEDVMVESASESGWLGPVGNAGEEARIRRVVAQGLSPTNKDGDYINRLKEMAEQDLRDAGIQPPSARVILLHEFDANACVRTVADEIIISVNWTLPFCLLMWWKAYLAIVTAASKRPYCVCRTSTQYAISILRISQTLSSGTFTPLFRGAIAACECRSGPDPGLSRLVSRSERFVLLHEYGHVVDSQADVAESPSRLREVRADRFARDVMIRAGAAPEQAALAGGIFLKMAEFQLLMPDAAPALESHPDPRTRVTALASGYMNWYKAKRPPDFVLIHDVFDSVARRLASVAPGEILPATPVSRPQ